MMTETPTRRLTVRDLTKRDRKAAKRSLGAKTCKRLTLSHDDHAELSRRANRAGMTSSNYLRHIIRNAK